MPIVYIYFVGNVQAFDCYTRASYDPTIDLKLCENVPDPEENNHTDAWLLNQYVSCPESWLNDQWTLEPETNLPYNNFFYSLLQLT